MKTNIQIEVVYALADEQVVIPIECPYGATLGEAIERSGIEQRCPSIDLDNMDVGVFGLKQPLDYVLSDQDRVEIYRPLLLTPVEARRLRAEVNRS